MTMTTEEAGKQAETLLVVLLLFTPFRLLTLLLLTLLLTFLLLPLLAPTFSPRSFLPSPSFPSSAPASSP